VSASFAHGEEKCGTFSRFTFGQATIHAKFCFDWDIQIKWLRFTGDLEICLAYQDIWEESSYLD